MAFSANMYAADRLVVGGLKCRQ